MKPSNLSGLLSDNLKLQFYDILNSSVGTRSSVDEKYKVLYYTKFYTTTTAVNVYSRVRDQVQKELNETN